MPRTITPLRAIVAALLLTLTGCASVPADAAEIEPATPSVTRGSSVHPVRVAVVGDSLTVGRAIPLLTASPSADTWTFDVDASREFKVIGGWAQRGASSEVMAQAAPELRGVDVLIVLSGSNNFREGVEFPQHTANLDEIARKIPADHTVLIAMPPMQKLAATGEIPERNALLAGFAADRGWNWLDPWGAYSIAQPYSWADPAMAKDGIHPTEAIQHEVGVAITNYLHGIVG